MSLLRPGLHVVRRDERHLQVGLDPPWRLTVPDDPAVVEVLDDLYAGRRPAPTSPEASRVLDALSSGGLLRPAPRPRAGRVAVSGAADLVAEARRLLGGHTTPRPTGADVALVLAAGEPVRAVVDEHLQAGRPHLVVSAGPHGYRVGPFVEPGVTPCLRCVDAHLGELDPRRPVVVEQLAGRTTAPDDPALAALAVAWAVGDALRHLDGGVPTTWSATVDVSVIGAPETRTWERHPYCGCSWGDALP